jgi:hypothetical protein
MINLWKKPRKTCGQPGESQLQQNAWVGGSNCSPRPWENVWYLGFSGRRRRLEARVGGTGRSDPFELRIAVPHGGRDPVLSLLGFVGFDEVAAEPAGDQEARQDQENLHGRSILRPPLGDGQERDPLPISTLVRY